MAFPSTNAGTLEQIFLNIRGVALKAKLKSQAVVSGNISGHQILDYLNDMRTVHAYFEQWKTTPGLAQYAKDQYNDQGLDIVAEFNAMQTAIQAVIDEIISTFPVSGGQTKYLQRETMDAQGVVTDRTFTPGQTSNLRTLIQAVIDAID